MTGKHRGSLRSPRGSARQRNFGFADRIRRSTRRMSEALPTACERKKRPSRPTQPTILRGGIQGIPAQRPAIASGVGESRYRLLEELGQGGMSLVYLAVRDGSRQPVAVKVLRPGMNTAELAQRFHSERRILSCLDHPNIAGMLAGGTLADGRPYLVMERIHGIQIDEYCDRHRLSIRKRLELFQAVCAAVDHAHRKLVVHRDIKPNNILVTAGGVPKLLDFGIAKLLRPAASPGTAEATQTHGRPMTPGYASPEQVRGEGITTASDIYSLGMLLYKLLTGRLPYRMAGLGQGEMEHLLLTKEPTKPSTAVGRIETWVTQSGAQREINPESVSRQRGAHHPRQLRRELAGNLDGIVLKALHRDPEQRYGSVEQLAADVSRHLDGLPVPARRGGLRQGSGKLLHRHKTAFAVASVIMAALASLALARLRRC